MSGLGAPSAPGGGMLFARLVAALGADPAPFQRDLASAKRQAQGWTNDVGGMMQRGMGNAMGKVAAVIAATGLVTTLGLIGKAVADITMQAAPLGVIATTFDNISAQAGHAKGEMLALLRESTAGMVANRDLMKSYNLAAQLVGEQFAEKLPEAMGYLLKVSGATGQGMDYMMDSLVRGVGRLSPLILDNLGITVDLEGAYMRWAAANGKAADSLGKTEQQAAVMDEVLSQLKKNTAAMPEVVGTLNQRLMAMRINFTNLKDSIGTGLQPMLEALLTTMEHGWPIVEHLANGFVKVMQLPAAALKAVGPLVVDELGDMLGAAEQYGQGFTQSFANGIANAIPYLLGVLMLIRRIITFWLEPGSPPRLLPKLTEWGTAAMKEWFMGWVEADFGTLRTLSQGLERIIQAMVGEGALDKTLAIPLLRRLRALVAQAIDEIKKTGEVTEETMAKIRQEGGPQGEALVGSYLKVEESRKRVKDIEEKLAKATTPEEVKKLAEELDLARKDLKTAEEAYKIEQAKLDVLAEESSLIGEQIGLMEQLANATEKAAGKAAGAAKKVADALAEIPEKLANVLSEKPAAAVNPFEALFNPEKIREQATRFADALWQGLEAPLYTMRDKVSKASEGVIKTIKYIWEGGEQYEGGRPMGKGGGLKDFFWGMWIDIQLNADTMWGKIAGVIETWNQIINTVTRETHSDQVTLLDRIIWLLDKAWAIILFGWGWGLTQLQFLSNAILGLVQGRFDVFVLNIGLMMANIPKFFTGALKALNIVDIDYELKPIADKLQEWINTVKGWYYELGKFIAYQWWLKLSANPEDVPSYDEFGGGDKHHTTPDGNKKQPDTGEGKPKGGKPPGNSAPPPPPDTKKKEPDKRPPGAGIPEDKFATGLERTLITQPLRMLVGEAPEYVEVVPKWLEDRRRRLQDQAQVINNETIIIRDRAAAALVLQEQRAARLRALGEKF